MGDATSIEWTDATWNPVRGCSRISPGCENCYAERQAARFSGPGMPYEGLVRIGKSGPRWTGAMRTITEHLADPLRWKRPRRVFVNSMSDLFHEGLTNEEIAAVLGVMTATPRHAFQMLTKRAKRMREWFAWMQPDPLVRISIALQLLEGAIPEDLHGMAMRSRGGGNTFTPWPLPNVWLGVSVEDQARADERIPELLATPAAVRFVSYEPALGPVELEQWLRPVFGDDDLLKCPAITWLIVGSESGPGARPMDLAWARRAVDQCMAAGVAVFTKQIATPEGRAAKAHKGGDPAHWPAGAWPREFPRAS